MPIDKTREDNNYQKNSVSVAHFSFTYLDLIADSGLGTIFMMLPNHVIITHLGLIVKSVPNAGANLTVDIDGTAIVANASLANNILYPYTPEHQHGNELVLKEGSVPPTQGAWYFFMLYIEYTKHTGEFTRFK